MRLPHLHLALTQPYLPARLLCMWQVKKLERELTEAERKVVEGEALRKRLHNTIQVAWQPAGLALAEEATALGAQGCTVRPQIGAGSLAWAPKTSLTNR